MTGPATPVTPEPSPPATATPAPGFGEGAQTALIALIRKRKLRGEPDLPGDAPLPPPGAASEP